jgi:hypothetical protein
MMSPRWLPVIVLPVAVALFAGCSSTRHTATSASTTTTGASPSVVSTSTAAGGQQSGPCALLTTKEIEQATSNTVATGVPDDSQAAAGEQHCEWAMSGTNGSGALAGSLGLNLETGSNALPNFAALRTGSIEHHAVTGVGDDAELTAGANLFIKQGTKVIEITYNGLPSTPVEPILIRLGQQAAARL